MSSLVKRILVDSGSAAGEETALSSCRLPTATAFHRGDEFSSKKSKDWQLGLAYGGSAF